jgi:hypothetical protein
VTGYSLFGQPAWVSSGTLAFAYTLPPFKARGWIFTNSLSTMLVTLPAERFAKYHYSLTSWKKDTSLSIANYAMEPAGIS